MATIKQLHDAINTFNNDFPRPNMEPVRATETHLMRDEGDRKATDYIPSKEHPGVYSFVLDGQVEYVGKTSCSSNLGFRLRRYFNAAGDWIDEKSAGINEYLVVPFPADRGFEAGALEEYLIANLNPLRNKQGRTN